MQRRHFLISFGLALLAGGVNGMHAAAEEPRRIVITAKRFAFDPGTITLKKDEPVVLVLQSQDVSHGLRFRDLGLELKAAKDKPGEVHYTPDKVGEFVGHCSVFCGSGHGGMTLTLRVEA